MRLSSLFLVVLLATIAARTHAAADPFDASSKNLVQASALADVDAVAPGGSFTLGVQMKIKKGWHTYWVNPGDSGEATRITCKGPAGLTFGAIHWPLPTRMEHEGTVTFGYEDEVLLMIPVKVAADAKLPEQVAISIEASWLSCDVSNCIEGAANLTVKLPVSDKANKANAAAFDVWRARLPGADTASSEALAKFTQVTKAGSPLTFEAKWNSKPAKVEWFPVSTKAASFDTVTVKHAGDTTHISVKASIFRANQLDKPFTSVLVYVDEKGVRRGVTLPFEVMEK